MDEKETTLAVARYVANNSERLKGTLDAKHYFNFVEYGNSQTYEGWAVDILAYEMARGKFFGEMVPASADQACNCNNGSLFPIRSSKEAVTVRAKKFVETPRGLLVMPPVAKAHPHVRILKARESFMEYSELVDLTGGVGNKLKTPAQVRKSIDRLFVSK